jgi:hypothetical protein
MSPASRDDSLEHDLWWHEDDVVHQAEGMLAVRLGVSVHVATVALRAHAQKTGADPRELAHQVVRREVHIPRTTVGPTGSESSPTR